jgi:hypothetical protein
MGIHYKFFPPKKFKWWGSGVRISSALRSEETWHEANTYIALPSLIAGTLLTAIAFLPEIFVNMTMFTFGRAMMLQILITLLLLLLTDRHLNKHFDSSDNRKL